MSNGAKAEYLSSILERYLSSEKEEKQKILNEFCKVCGYNRKYAIRKLNRKPEEKPSKRKSRRGPKPRYDSEELVDFLKSIWKASNLVCSKRMKAMIVDWLGWYKKDGKSLSKETKELLLSISPSTIDRILRPYRSKYEKRGLCTTKPGSILRNLVPIKTNQWDERRPGFVEVDTVAHCGSSVSGEFVNTLNVVDIATGWTSQRALWGKGQTGVIKALREIELALPFTVRGFDCDNGNELLNWQVLKYFKNRPSPVSYTRSRAYMKNDNAHIEEKNWTVVRQYIGYQRLDRIEVVEMLNDLYRNELYYFLNFFIPSAKLIEKKRIGSKIKKIHLQPRTPYARLKESGYLEKATQSKLEAIKRNLNPFKLQRTINQKIRQILKMTFDETV